MPISAGYLGSAHGNGTDIESASGHRCKAGFDQATAYRYLHSLENYGLVRGTKTAVTFRAEDRWALQCVHEKQQPAGGIYDYMVALSQETQDRVSGRAQR